MAESLGRSTSLSVLPPVCHVSADVKSMSALSQTARMLSPGFKSMSILGVGEGAAGAGGWGAASFPLYSVWHTPTITDVVDHTDQTRDVSAIRLICYPALLALTS